MKFPTISFYWTSAKLGAPISKNVNYIFSSIVGGFYPYEIAHMHAYKSSDEIQNGRKIYYQGGVVKSVVQIPFARDSNEWNAGVEFVFVWLGGYGYQWHISNPYEHSFVFVAVVVNIVFATIERRWTKYIFGMNVLMASLMQKTISDILTD